MWTRDTPYVFGGKMWGRGEISILVGSSHPSKVFVSVRRVGDETLVSAHLFWGDPDLFAKVAEILRPYCGEAIIK